MLNGWYDWGLDLTLETWALIEEFSNPHVRDNAVMVITPRMRTIALAITREQM